MTREEKIRFLAKRLSDRLTEAYLKTKSDSFINHLFEVESGKDDRDLEEALFSF